MRECIPLRDNRDRSYTSVFETVGNLNLPSQHVTIGSLFITPPKSGLSAAVLINDQIHLGTARSRR
ncbi:hypothetical protein JCM15831A_08910 [Asaia astilbis]